MVRQSSGMPWMLWSTYERREMREVEGERQERQERNERKGMSSGRGWRLGELRLHGGLKAAASGQIDTEAMDREEAEVLDGWMWRLRIGLAQKLGKAGFDLSGCGWIPRGIR